MSLTAYRITRLLVQDTFPPIEVQRARVAARWGDESWQAYLSRCPWCAVGVTVSAAVTLATDLATSVPLPVLTGVAVAALVGLMSSVDRALDRD